MYCYEIVKKLSAYILASKSFLTITIQNGQKEDYVVPNCTIMLLRQDLEYVHTIGLKLSYLTCKVYIYIRQQP